MATAFDETTYLRPAVAGQMLRRTRAGASFVYAVGERPDRDHPTVVLLLDAVRAGAIELHLAGRDASGRLRHAARRLPHPPGAARGEADGGGSDPAHPVRFDPADPDPESPEADVLGQLALAAARGLPCPSHEALSDHAGHPALSDRHRARRAFDKLVALGLVRVIEPARFGARVIEIVSTGQRTAPQVAR